MDNTHQVSSSSENTEFKSEKKAKLSSFLILMEKLDSLVLELPIPPNEEQRNTQKSSGFNTYSLLSLDGSTKFLRNEMALTLGDLGISSKEFFTREIIESSSSLRTADLIEKFESSLKDKIKANINKILDQLSHAKSEFLSNIAIDWTNFKQKCIQFIEIVDYTDNSSLFVDVCNIIDILSTRLANFSAQNFNLAKKSDFSVLLSTIDSFLDFDELKSNLFFLKNIFFYLFC